MGPIVIRVPTLSPTDALLTRVFTMRLVRDHVAADDGEQRLQILNLLLRKCTNLTRRQPEARVRRRHWTR